MPSSFRLVALDIDGTLVNSASRIPPENREAICQLIQQGIQVILVTGRRYETGAPIARELGLDLPVIFHNGALIRHAVTGKVEYHLPLPREVACQAIDILLNLHLDPILHYPLEPEGKRVVLGPLQQPNQPWLLAYLQRNHSLIRRVKDLKEVLDTPPTHIMVGTEITQAEEVLRALKEALGDSARILETRYLRENLSYIDILHPDCSKKNALAFYTRKLGINPEEILAIGDNFNDLEMLEFSGKGIVMGNAPEPVLRLGFPVTDTNDRAGVAQALKQYILNRAEEEQEVKTC